jgi:hypothetical protein
VGTSLASLVPELEPYARELVRIAGANGLHPRITSTRRNYQEQRSLYDRYLRGVNPYPVAPPGSSSHETGEAFDMLVTPVEYLPDLGAIWTEWGGQWGGNKDPVHFQLRGAPSPELLAQTKSWAAQAFEDPYLTAAKATDLLPWYVGLLAPWQLWLYENFPSVRVLINPTWGMKRINQFLYNFAKELS